MTALHPFDGHDLWTLLASRAGATPAAPFLTWQPFDQPATTMTYADVALAAAELAAGLQHRGVRAGDRVLIHLDNSPEFVLLWLACAATGAIAVTTNTRSSVDELQYYVDTAAVVGAVTQPKHLANVLAAGPSLKWVVSTTHDSGIPSDTALGVDSFSELHGNADDLIRPTVDPARSLAVQFTSGTTARPKGVVWTHANALWAARANAAHEDLRRDDCHLVYLPLFHANALSFSVLPSLWVGSRVVLTPKWSTSRFWDLSMQHRCTWLSLIGLSLRAVMDLPAPEGHAYRLFGTGVSADAFPGAGVKTIGWWGMTETVAAPIAANPHLPNRFGTIGRPAPGYEVAVVDDDGRPASVGEPGHLLVRGTPGITMFAGYLDDPAATAAAYDDYGWFRTGDLVTRHDDGTLDFVDRDKDVIRVGAENVAASEVERVIHTVSGVVEAAVVARAHESLDEVPVAFVRSSASSPGDLPQRILDACKELLADFKVPREVYLVDELPRSGLSKVDKKTLREILRTDGDLNAAAASWVAAASTDPSGDAG